jgi:Cu/Ag efflux pump CusA
VAAEVARAIKEVSFQLQYHAEVVGGSATGQGTWQRLGLAGLIAVIGIFLLFQAALGSWRLALLAFVTLPVALAGGAIAAPLARAVPLGLLLGFLVILAIAVRNGILLVNHYQHLEQVEGEPFGPGLVLRGSRERVAPTVLTALTAAAVFLPFAIAGDIPGNEIVHSIAIVAMGGLVTTILLTLFLFPVLYLRFGASREPVRPSVPSTAPAVSQ